jgi:hypothetical protein
MPRCWVAAIKDMRFPEQCVDRRDHSPWGDRGAARRDGRSRLGDEVLAVTDRAGAVQLAELFAPPPNGKYVAFHNRVFSRQRKPGFCFFGLCYDLADRRLASVTTAAASAR